jgi:orotidine-5'-phosphate decarboxylase
MTLPRDITAAIDAIDDAAHEMRLAWGAYCHPLGGKQAMRDYQETLREYEQAVERLRALLTIRLT